MGRGCERTEVEKKDDDSNDSRLGEAEWSDGKEMGGVKVKDDRWLVLVGPQHIRWLETGTRRSSSPQVGLTTRSGGDGRKERRRPAIQRKRKLSGDGVDSGGW
jgi:hypothetical protein